MTFSEGRKKAAVIGAAGFAGIELVRLLVRHPAFELVAVTSDAFANQKVSDHYPALIGQTNLSFCANADLDRSELDIAFLAVPHTAALDLAPALLEKGITVVDLSADFRLKDADTYEAWYGAEHTQRSLLKEAAFGLPEVTGEELVHAAQRHAKGQAVLVACAGCYPTATSLAAAPLLLAGLGDAGSSVVVDAVSGVTGAGKSATERTHFCFANNNIEAYGVAKHRHTPEIEQILNIPNRLVFTPHLAPVNRGILSTVTIKLAEEASDITIERLQQLYEDYYAASPFVFVLPQGTLPKTSSVVGTNNAHVSVVLHKPTRSAIALCAIDNICKGAAGQAIQCANIVFGFPQTAGLEEMALPI